MMWRYFAGAAAALLLVGAGIFLFRGSAAPDSSMLPSPPATARAAAGQGGEALPDAAPRASARTREQKRFDRYDKDRDEVIGREEYLASRRKAFARLDADGDGRLSFEEWAVRTTTKFAAADRDKSGTLTRVEFATTAPKPRPTRAACACPTPAPAEAGDD